MPNEYTVTVYKATSPPDKVTTLRFVGPCALVSKVKSELVSKLKVDSDNIVFLNYNEATRGEGSDDGARRISDKDCIWMIEDYEGDASSDVYGGEFPSAQTQRFTLHYGVRADSDDDWKRDKNEDGCINS